MSTPIRLLPNSDVEADVALGRCAPSGPRSLTPVVRRTQTVPWRTSNALRADGGDLQAWRHYSPSASAANSRYAAGLPIPEGVICWQHHWCL
jgi:hypothetical protein